jgi:hypothetical protein
VGARVPEHIYDANGRPLVTMPSAELAAFVVASVNGAARTETERQALEEAEKVQDGLLRRVERLEAVLKAGRDNVAYVRTRADLESWREQAEAALYGEVLAPKG